MSTFRPAHFDTEGPFGLLMSDRQARALAAMLQTLPQEEYLHPRKALLEQAPAELLPGERADVSWISAEAIDREGDIVLASGMDDSHFKLNPLVTLQHATWLPPVGRSVWRRKASDGPLRGIKAKTHYFPRPADWPAESDWLPDVAFALVQAGLLRGKSIGFLPLKARRPSTEEIERDPALARVRFIIEKWLLLEYACVYLPAQQHALVEQVSKGLRLSQEVCSALGVSELPRVAFTPLAEIEKALQRQVAQLDYTALICAAVQQGINRLRGRV